MRRWIALGFAVSLGLGSPALATPESMDGVKGPPHWPDGSTIHVYIPKDPRGRTRDQQIADGVSGWNEDPTLKAHNIKFVPVIGDPPADPGHSVTVKWVPEKPKVDDGKGGQKSVDAATSPSVDTADGTIDSATMDVYDDPDDTSADASKKLGAHEAGHALGIKHSESEDSVMNEVPKTDKPSAEDHKEIKATYDAEAGHAQVTPTVKFEDGLWRYQYDVAWEDGTELALFQVAIGGATLSDYIIPDGWRLDDFSHDADVAFSTLGDPQGRFVSFILADESSYLGADHPLMTFGFSTASPPGMGEAYLNGGINTLAPVPEPATWALLIGGCALAGAALRRQHRCRKNGAGEGIRTLDPNLGKVVLYP